MNEAYFKRFKWILFGAILLMVYLLQTVVFSHVTVFGTKLSLLVATVCIMATTLEHTKAGWLALGVAGFWSLTGQSSGGVYLLFLPVVSLLIAWLCTHYFARNFGTALMAGAFGVAACEGGFILQQWYMEQPMQENILTLWLIQIGCAAVLSPVLWALLRLVERLVKPWKEV